MKTHVDPTPILQTGFAFFASKTLLTAVELEIFTILGSRAMTGQDLGQAAGLHPRGIWDFLDALVALGFLAREGEGPAARYRNTEATGAFLDKARGEQFMGGILELANARLYRFWNDLGPALRTGKPQNEIKNSEKPMFEALYSDPARLEQFMNAMAGISRPNFAALAQKFDFSRFKTVCDVGGASGVMSVELARRHPHLSCTSFDLPQVEPIAKRSIERAGLSGRVRAVAGDFLKDKLPKADVITMGMILHDWNLEKKMHLIRLAYEALPENGAFIVVESLIDDSRRENAFGLMMSLNMLIEFGDAFDYSARDFQGWCREAGFRRFETIHLNGPSSAAIAYK